MRRLARRLFALCSAVSLAKPSRVQLYLAQC